MAKSKSPSDFLPSDWRLFRALFEVIRDNKPNRLEKAHALLKERRGTCQSLTVILNRFEDDLQLPRGTLINRNTCTMQPEAERLYGAFGRLLELYNETIDDSRGAKRPKVRLTTTPTFATLVLPLILEHSRFLERYPTIDFVVHSGQWRHSRDALLQRTVDFAFCTNSPHLVSENFDPLRSISRVFIYPISGPIYDRFKKLDDGKIAFDKNDLRDVIVFHLPQDLYRDDVDIRGWLPKVGKGGRVEVNQQAILRSLVRRGLGVAISHEMPRALTDVEAVHTTPLHDELGSIELCIFYHPGVQGEDRFNQLSQPTRDLITAIRTFCTTAWDK